MSEFLHAVLSHDCGPFWQFVKYGLVGMLSTGVQVAVFYLLAATCLRCLKPDDCMVRLLKLPSVSASDGVRAIRFAAATAIGFLLANIFCWLMNRWFVFAAGRFCWYLELLLFVSVSALAMAIATTASCWLIKRKGMMTSLAMALEVVVSFGLNYFLRKYMIFLG